MRISIFGYFANRKYNGTEKIVPWYESICKNYISGLDRDIIICTDNDDAEKDERLKDAIFFRIDKDMTSDTGMNKLRKFRILYDAHKALGSRSDYIAFVQSNARCVSPVSIEELTSGLSSQISACTHPLFPKMSFRSLHYEKHGSCVSMESIDTSSFKYFQSGHFLARKDAFADMCESIVGNVEKDMLSPRFKDWYPSSVEYCQFKNGKQVVYDESYFNYYMNVSVHSGKKYSVSVLDGNVYCRGFFSSEKNFKIEMVDKRKWK